MRLDPISRRTGRLWLGRLAFLRLGEPGREALGGAVDQDAEFVFPMTVITPARPARFQRIRQRLSLFAGRHWPSVVLADLSFIHGAHWAALERLPDPGRRGPAGAPLPMPYLVFVSNFNGARDEYIEMFSDRISARIDRIYADCHGFPGARPASALIGYLDRHHHDAAVYYAAYPEATTRMVRSAVEVRTQLRYLRLCAAAMSPDELGGAWTGFLRRVERHLW